MRAGDARMNPLFVAEEKQALLADLSEQDEETLVQINIRNRNWEAIFKFLWMLPARQCLAAVNAMREAGWQPEDPDRAALWTRLVELTTMLQAPPSTARSADACVRASQGPGAQRKKAKRADGGVDAPPPDPPSPVRERSPRAGAGHSALPHVGGYLGTVPLPAVLHKWLNQGATGKLAATLAGELREMIREDVPPPEQFAALGAVRQAGQLTKEIVEAAGRSRHWVVRMVAVHFGASLETAMKVNDAGREWFEGLAMPQDAGGLWGMKTCQVARDGLSAPA